MAEVQGSLDSLNKEFWFATEKERAAEERRKAYSVRTGMPTQDLPLTPFVKSEPKPSPNKVNIDKE